MWLARAPRVVNAPCVAWVTASPSWHATDANAAGDSALHLHSETLCFPMSLMQQGYGRQSEPWRCWDRSGLDAGHDVNTFFGMLPHF